MSQQNIPVGSVWYNSLQTNVQKRYSKGFSLTGSYTFSKNIQALSYLNAQDAVPARTIVPFDRTHVFTLASVYELPFGPGRTFLNTSHSLISRLVGGWQVMGNFTWQSGVPMTVPSGVFVVGNPVLADPTPAHMFNTGLIQANGTVVNTVNGLAAGIPDSARLHAADGVAVLRQSPRPLGAPTRYGAHQEHQNQGATEPGDSRRCA